MSKKSQDERGPVGDIAAKRRAVLTAILSKSPRPGLDIDLLVRRIEVVDGLKTNRPEWVAKAASFGVVRKPPTVTAHFPQTVAAKRAFKRARDGLTGLKSAFGFLTPAERQRVANEAFKAVREVAETGTSEAVIHALLEHLLTGTKARISELSRMAPSSNKDLQRRAMVAWIAAAFREQDVSIGHGSNSVFVLVCKVMGVPRTTVEALLPEIMKEIDSHRTAAFDE